MVTLRASEHPPPWEHYLPFLSLCPLCLKLLTMLSVGVAVVFTLFYISLGKEEKDLEFKSSKP